MLRAPPVALVSPLAPGAVAAAEALLEGAPLGVPPTIPPPVPPPPIPVAFATEDGMYPPTELAKRIGASEASTAVPSIVTGTLTFRLW